MAERLPAAGEDAVRRFLAGWNEDARPDHQIEYDALPYPVRLMLLGFIVKHRADLAQRN